ncbi:hypothetical protein K470DRAFT_281653 [Piedraia hortae CBS 480.64]|uniref:Lysine decarboxylase-like protein-like protein n=1 Tax=Piedraia hortae CBS 480.64 TaxID=1314780 RepID=A0A6A7C0Z8_9PEZI|nr:hypothetical protein K470DRAFT_281653 [Piedraia hortae CBS 480.64]
MSSSPNDAKPVICAFSGSSPGNNASHMAAAKALAHTLHAHGYNLVYGGGTVGLMGELARTLVSLSGSESVHGIIPEALLKYEGKDIDKSTYGKTTVVKDMHTRKKLMADAVVQGGKGSGFVALSGGYGTLEELMEITTWQQLGIHQCPVVVLNIDGYWGPILEWVRNAVKEGFVAAQFKDIMLEAASSDQVVEDLKGYTYKGTGLALKWEDD